MDLDKLKTTDGLDIKGKRVLLRADLNVPVKDGQVTDATRLERVLPGLEDLARRGAKVVLISHFGRPKGGPDPEFSLAPVAAKLTQLTGRPIAFVPDCIGETAEKAVAALKPGDIAVLFRSRASHREFEHELELAGVPTYVYKGLGFFDADETKDLMALIRYLANPASDLRAAALLRSRFIRLSDRGLATLAPGLARAIIAPDPSDAAASLDEEDQRVLAMARVAVPGWLARVDRVPPAELLEHILVESAYAYELRGPRQT